MSSDRTCGDVWADHVAMAEARGGPTIADYERLYAEDRAAIRALIPGHPATADCRVDECPVCGMRDCPLGADEHYWHDGCPACYGVAMGIVAWGLAMRKMVEVPNV